MKNIAIFASGNGSNAENIINFFADTNKISIKLILSNKKDAFVVERAKKHNIECVIIEKKQFLEENYVVNILKAKKIDTIVLAGFLLLIPKCLVSAYSGKIINIHPALLPKYGGKGMYGMNVHKAVIENSEKQSGITIHNVNEEYDKGEIIFSAACDITPDDTPDSLAAKVHELEYKYFPAVIEKWLENKSLKDY